jgi:large subunit ribosomal protein L23
VKGEAKPELDPYDVILYPVMTEVASRMLEAENKLVFAVSLKASRADIKRAVEELYEVKVERVTLSITPKRGKKAFVKLHPDFKAADVAVKLGIL